ncbi:hypothetical protein RSal33209_1864 [Renibacterium salmoninarum ATCC 33209]|uniref:Uncharacterized protein n=1 Tax=Renibacterium salmoninarum (strain ATCC 33209 / DSM 20767 / JCM 11484 / NBRC 15589 / NCIMB 2235) TaxID=288705 RepID=A9WQP0_RENSM|nr:hypothetical protein RSal33209_1864 [Renibacterium salmoninarum ATCC 33209]
MFLPTEMLDSVGRNFDAAAPHYSSPATPNGG